MRREYSLGEEVVCLQPSPNMCETGKTGKHYRIIAIAPKVRVSRGGEWFLVCEAVGRSLSNLPVALDPLDVRVITKGKGGPT